MNGQTNLDPKKVWIPSVYLVTAIVAGISVFGKYQYDQFETRNQISKVERSCQKDSEALKDRIIALETKLKIQTRGRWPVEAQEMHSHEVFQLLQKYHPELTHEKKPDAYEIRHRVSPNLP